MLGESRAAVLDSHGRYGRFVSDGSLRSSAAGRNMRGTWYRQEYARYFVSIDTTSIPYWPLLDIGLEPAYQPSRPTVLWGRNKDMPAVRSSGSVAFCRACWLLSPTVIAGLRPHQRVIAGFKRQRPRCTCIANSSNVPRRLAAGRPTKHGTILQPLACRNVPMPDLLIIFAAGFVSLWPRCSFRFENILDLVYNELSELAEYQAVVLLP